MHDDTPSGRATADRALAYWQDPGNFASEPRRMGSAVPAEVRDEEPVQDTKAWRRGFWYGQVVVNQQHVKTTWY
jgi:hypothetical protein